MDIYYVERYNGTLQKEQIAGEKWLRWIYETRGGLGLLELIVKRKIFSQVYGCFQNTRASARKIEDFVHKLSINMDEAMVSDLKAYRSFNDFFTRRLKPEARPINPSQEVLISPADGKILAFADINPEQLFQVKHLTFSLDELLGSQALAQSYRGGVYLVIRLAPPDYHRFHFPDAGVPMASRPITGHYYSVSPLSLSRIAHVYCQNKRTLTKFNSDNFGTLLLLEVGATCVGSILQTYIPDHRVTKGTEKGFFKFGGSTVIVLIQPGYLQVDEDILANTARGYETKVQMGEGIGRQKI